MDVLRDAQVDPYCLRDYLHDRTAPVGDPALPVVPIESSAATPTGTTTETGAAGLVEVQESFDSPGGFPGSSPVAPDEVPDLPAAPTTFADDMDLLVDVAMDVC